MSQPGPLLEALAWLDYCLEEAVAAMAAVKAAAKATPGLPNQKLHDICEATAAVVTLRGRCARWGKEIKPC